MMLKFALTLTMLVLMPLIPSASPTIPKQNLPHQTVNPQDTDDKVDIGALIDTFMKNWDQHKDDDDDAFWTSDPKSHPNLEDELNKNV